MLRKWNHTVCNLFPRHSLWRFLSLLCVSMVGFSSLVRCAPWYGGGIGGLTVHLLKDIWVLAVTSQVAIRSCAGFSL